MSDDAQAIRTWWRTSIIDMEPGKIAFRDHPIQDLIGNVTFPHMIWLMTRDALPSPAQAALFEVMEEKQVSMDGTTYKMSFPFMVIATQNPIEQEGTYKLPEAQLDRFLFRIVLQYPSLEEEQQILRRFKDDFSTKNLWGS